MYIKRSLIKSLLIFVMALHSGACVDHGSTIDRILDKDNPHGHSLPTLSTKKANERAAQAAMFENTQDFIDARRGFIARDDDYYVSDKEQILFDSRDYHFVDNDGINAPPSVHPGLWRQAALNNIHGLFEVTDGIYQLRGLDLANMTIIVGKTGWIIVDPLTSKEAASKALLLAQKHLGKHPITAILYTHSHIDHFGGIGGIIEHLSEAEKDKLRIIAPAGFVEEVTSENITAGIAMGRRAGFMYGMNLAHNHLGHVDTGLGKNPITGEFTLELPTEIIDSNNLSQQIDGIDFEFSIVSGSEAPSEFIFYLPQKKAFCGAELVSRNLHNLYTLRGAQVRDGQLWSQYIEQARLNFSDAEVYFGSHHWPLWGKDKIDHFMRTQRDTYKFIHDQTVRLMNNGLTPNEIANQLRLPESLRSEFHNQGYYGTVEHNAKAVYQFYLGWYTANPAKLHPLPEQEVALQYMEFMGGINNVLSRAEEQFDLAANADGDSGNRLFRWLAEILNHAVYADPNNKRARLLLATVYDQLGYQAESGPWRNAYLTGAYELRNGAPQEGITPAKMKQTLMVTPIPLFLDSMSVRLNANKAEGEVVNLLLNFTDKNEIYVISVENSVLHHRKVDEVESMMLSDSEQIKINVYLTFPMFVDIATGEVKIEKLIDSEQLKIEGSFFELLDFLAMLDRPKGNFNIVTP